MVRANHLNLPFEVFSGTGCGDEEFVLFLTWLFRNSDSSFLLHEMDSQVCRHGVGLSSECPVYAALLTVRSIGR